jgi:hypothetical protein
MSSAEFIERLFGDLPALFRDETEPSCPETVIFLEAVKRGRAASVAGRPGAALSQKRRAEIVRRASQGRWERHSEDAAVGESLGPWPRFGSPCEGHRGCQGQIRKGWEA